MKRIMCGLFALVFMSASLPVSATEPTPHVNINIPTIDKNWFDDYRPSYRPSATRPDVAPSAIGIRSLSSHSQFDYNQSLNSLRAQAEQFYVNSFKEIFPPGNQRILTNLVSESSTQRATRTNTGNAALDSFESEQFRGLTDDQLKWLINNNVISRNPRHISITPDNIQIGEMDPLFTRGRHDPMRRSEFLMALHRATYGVIESRPLVFDITPYRWASRITWDLDILNDTYYMIVEPEAFQRVNTGFVSSANRGEFKTRLQGDTHYVVATFPEPDKMFVTTPNVMELYIKSLLDKGILHSSNLPGGPDYNPESINSLNPALGLRRAFEAYGVIDATRSQHFPLYAPELGPYEDGRHHTFFDVIPVPNTSVWGAGFTVSENSITHNPDVDFFQHELMTTMEALRFIETILRSREGDMTDTEARIVSYKYGVNFIEYLPGSDRSTVMYLTAKGILNFENFIEYTFLYTPFEREFGYTLLYRVANPAARMNFSEIQLTDSDNFWIGRGFSGFRKTVRVPNISAIQSYLDGDGHLTVDPQQTTGDNSKNILHLVPFVQTQAIYIADFQQNTPNEVAFAALRSEEILLEGLYGNMTDELSDEYFRMQNIIAQSGTVQLNLEEVTYLADGTPVMHERGLDIHSLAGEDLYEGRDFLTTIEDAPVSIISRVSGVSPFASNTVTPVSDSRPRAIVVEKLVDDPFKYLFDQRPIVYGPIPVTLGERRANLTPALHPDHAPEIASVVYHPDADAYTVTFVVSAVCPVSALQLVNSNLEMTANVLTVAHDVNVVSRVTRNGERVTLISGESLSVLDPDLVIVSDKVLLNRRTNAKAIILPEQNVALVGNHIIEAGDDTLMIQVDADRVYYNLDIISSLLSNTFLSSISSRDFYSGLDVQPEVYMPVFTSRGDRIATAIVGNFTHLITQPRGDGDEPRPDITVSSPFVNLSQLTAGGNVLIKDFTMETDDGFPLDFTVVVEWMLRLPDSRRHLNMIREDASRNPSLREINNFFFTRPSNDVPELQEFWDNNIAISNAIANVMYSTIGAEYINSGFLMPNISFLFHVDDSNTVGGTTGLPYLGNHDSNINGLGANLLDGDQLQAVAGAWFQEVGNELPLSWVNTFFGSPEIFNRILRRNSPGMENSPDYYQRWVENGTIILVGDYHYRLAANEGSVFFTDKHINFNWFPAWVHTSFNNPFIMGQTTYNASIAANGLMWRELTGDRRFGYYPRRERRSFGTVFGHGDPSGTTWILLPSGALYKSMNPGSGYRISGDGILVETRTRTTDFGLLVGRTLIYNGAYYYVSRFDNQFLELIALDAIRGVARDGGFWVDDRPMQEVGHATLRERFITQEGSSMYNERRDTVDIFQETGNALPSSFYSADVPFLITDAAGGWVVRQFSTTSQNGRVVTNSRDLLPAEYNNRSIYYHPVIRLSVLGWDVTGPSDNILIYRRTIPALLFNDMFPASLTRTVIDTLISRVVDVTPLEDIPPGSTVLFGDIYLYRSHEGFITSPIRVTSTKHIPVVRNGMVSPDDLAVLASGILNMTLNSNGRSETVANYISSVSLAPQIEHDLFVYSNTMVAFGRNQLEPFLATGNSSTPRPHNTLSPVRSVSYLINFDRGLVAMPTSSDGREFTLLFTATESGLGTVIDLPYFVSDLNFYVRNRVSLEAFPSNFNPLPNQHELRQEFISQDRQQAMRDFAYVARSTLAFILGYLMIMCTLIFFALKITTINVVLSKIRNISIGGRGPDIVRYLSLGIMSVDHDISGVRMFKSMMLLCALFAVIVLTT